MSVQPQVPVSAGKGSAAVPQHTPGPWRVLWNHGVGPNDRTMVCKPDGLTEAQALANARLIAAAPNLKSAAISAVDQLQPLYDAMKGGAAREVIGDVLREMRAALSKATTHG